MARKVIDQPVEEALKPADVQAQIKAYSSEAAAMEAVYTRWIIAARQAAEGELLRPLLPQTCSERVDAIGSAGVWLWNDATEVISVTYKDVAGEEQSLPSTGYRLVKQSRLMLIGTAPAGTDFEIRFKAGAWSSADEVPEAIKAWMLLQIGALAANPEATTTVQTYALPANVTEMYLRQYAAISV